MEENPIDKDHITDKPNTLEYGHHRGSQLVKPEDKGKLKGRAISAMEQQTDQQLTQIKEQMALLAEQASKIQKRKTLSEQIYMAEMRFEPLINHIYHLYQKENGNTLLSLIGPNNWGKKGSPYAFLGTVRLLADHTWEMIED